MNMKINFARNLKIYKIVAAIIVCFVFSSCFLGSTVVNAGQVATATDSATATTTDAAVISGYDLQRSIAGLRLVYVDNNNVCNVIKQTNGFFIGGEGEEIYIVTGKSNITLTDEEISHWANVYGVERKNFSTKIQLVILPDIIIDATIYAESSEMDFLMLKSANTLGDVTTLRFCEDNYKNKNGDIVKVLGKTDDGVEYYSEGIILDWATRDNVHYYKHSIRVNDDNYGCPILNSDNEVIGINLLSDKADNYALQIQDVIELCNALGINYNPEIQLDMTALETAMSRYEETIFEKYSNESVAVCKAEYDKVKLLLDEINEGKADYTTQDKIDHGAEQLTIALDGLRRKHLSMKQITIIFIIVSCLLFIGVIVLTIILIVRNIRFKKKLEEEKNNTVSAKDALALSGRITPGDKENFLNASMPVNRSLASIAGDNEFIAKETSVLGSSDKVILYKNSENIQNHAFLLRKRTGEEILINKNSFVIGKAAEMVDYYIPYNSGISRKHACIKCIKGNYYIQDMNTTNGTYVDGVLLTASSDVILQDGSIIMIADEEFEFRK